MDPIAAVRITSRLSYQRTWTCSACLAAQQQTVSRRVRAPQQRQFSISNRKAHQTQRHGSNLPNGPARTRFAPSPTGTMHIGGLRTALYSYLLAKKTGGQFILRIEDTDQKRFVPGATERLCEDLQWAGLHWDEGPLVGGDHGPYQQSHRLQIYRDHAAVLLNSEAAYRCFCTPLTQGVGTTAYVTSGCYQDCSSVTPGDSDIRAVQGQTYTVRLKSATDNRRRNPDLVYGNIKRLQRSPGAVSVADHDAPDSADTVLVKSDGMPTYHFANVVDDHLMMITHVIRGTEWMASTPLHYDLYHAFGWTPPLFAHVGLLLDEDKAKLSKRNAQDVFDVRGLQEQHSVLPEALCNYLALQGWSNPRDTDVLDLNELTESFDLKFTKGNSITRLGKLQYLQKQHIARRRNKASKSEDISCLNQLSESLANMIESQFPRHGQAVPTGMSLNDFCTVLLLVDGGAFPWHKSEVSRRFGWLFDFSEHEQHSLEGQPSASTDRLVLQVITQFEATHQRSVLADMSAVQVADQLRDQNEHIIEMIRRTLWRDIVDEDKQSELDTLLSQCKDQQTLVAALFTEAEDRKVAIEAYQQRYAVVFKQLRRVLCDGSNGLGIGFVMAILGPHECLRRLNHAHAIA